MKAITASSPKPTAACGCLTLEMSNEQSSEQNWQQNSPQTSLSDSRCTGTMMSHGHRSLRRGISRLCWFRGFPDRARRPRAAPPVHSTDLVVARSDAPRSSTTSSAAADQQPHSTSGTSVPSDRRKKKKRSPSQTTANAKPSAEQRLERKTTKCPPSTATTSTVYTSAMPTSSHTSTGELVLADVTPHPSIAPTSQSGQSVPGYTDLVCPATTVSKAKNHPDLTDLVSRESSEPLAAPGDATSVQLVTAPRLSLFDPPEMQTEHTRQTTEDVEEKSCDINGLFAQSTVAVHPTRITTSPKSSALRLRYRCRPRPAGLIWSIRSNQLSAVFLRRQNAKQPLALLRHLHLRRVHSADSTIRPTHARLHERLAASRARALKICFACLRRDHQSSTCLAREVLSLPP